MGVAAWPFFASTHRLLGAVLRLAARARLRAFPALLLGCALAGCGVVRAFPPGQAVVSEIQLEGLESREARAILDRLATTESPRFLGIWDGVGFEYEVYDPELLKQDLLRVERALRALGYFEAKVTAARVIALDDHRVRIELRARLGAPVLIEQVTFNGLEQVPIEVAVEVLGSNKLRASQAFTEADYDASKNQTLKTLRNRGYAFAAVTGSVDVDIARHAAVVKFSVQPGVPSVYDAVKVRGLHEVPEDVVLDQVSIEPGSPFSQAELDDARTALAGLGVFATVKVRADIEHAAGNRIPIVISVEEAPLRSVRLGGGIALDSLEASTHLGFEWQDRNFLGGARRFTLGLKPGVVFFPTRFGNLKLPNRELIEGQLNLSLRQPSLFEGRTSGVASTDFNLFPLLYAQSDENSAVVGFAEVRSKVGLERQFFEHHLLVAPGYNWQFEQPVDYRHFSFGREVDASEELLSRLILAYPELLATLDFRDDVLATRRGFYFSSSIQWSNRIFGSDVDDVRVQPQVRFFLPISSSVTLATRFSVGFLFGQYQARRSPNDNSFAERRRVALDQQKLLFRGFFSGGAASNRGYAIGGVGPRGEVLFLTPDAQYCSLAPNARVCNEPLGGVSLWEGSLEVRFPIYEAFSGVWFVDASNVGAKTRLDFTAPHVSSGLGFRYATPLGPARLDVGFRIPYLQELGRVNPSDPAYANAAYPGIHLTIGEAF